MRREPDFRPVPPARQGQPACVHERRDMWLMAVIPTTTLRDIKRQPLSGRQPISLPSWVIHPTLLIESRVFSPTWPALIPTNRS
jgi:hypothetical protein